LGSALSKVTFALYCIAVGVLNVGAFSLFLQHSELHALFSVDIYDGDSTVGPLVFHGGTLTSSVPVRDICAAIARYAFVASPFPVLISAEIHCSVEQQDMMVQIMDEVFGDMLVRAPVEGRERIERLPSPEKLKGKVLLKVRFSFVHVPFQKKPYAIISTRRRTHMWRLNLMLFVLRNTQRPKQKNQPSKSTGLLPPLLLLLMKASLVQVQASSTNSKPHYTVFAIIPNPIPHPRCP
jgi:Phosphatidylinositol-specific phospholipase C, X domain